MTHIVSELKDTPTVSPHWVLHNKAADEIERLRKELKMSCQALLLAANKLENLGSLDCDAGDAYDAADAARKALKGKE
jgi:hypothetical protein